MKRLTLLMAIMLSGLAVAPAPQPAGRRVAEPMLLDVNGDGFSFTSVDDGVLADLDGDGVDERVAWTTQSTDDAFICVDNNHDGRIQIPGDLVGGSSGPPNGFAYLAAMDGIKLHPPEPVRDRHPDGVIDKDDALYADLILWTDANHNGKSEENELQSLAYAGVMEVATGYEGVSSSDAFGNRIRFRAQARLSGKRGVDISREVVTVRFASH